ncbi:glycosyltransferase family 4 protein, partial [Desulfovibrio sp. OttesenSCG-928-M14]|nr:glycosyltransferase family 4 protein [Desulfovibrio sp. OttesenSCG-928-M14]
IEVVPYAAPEGLLTCTPQRPQALLPAGFFFYPAQFWQHKNHLRLLEALGRVKAHHPDIHCVFSGSTSHQGYAPFMEAIQTLRLAQNVTVLGYVSTAEIAWLYRHARGLIMPTLFGPTNIPPLEAMALACPVAVSDIYAMREQCGDAALYFNPHDTGDMALAISRLWTDAQTRSRLVEKGLAHHNAWNYGHMKSALTATLREQLEQR